MTASRYFSLCTDSSDAAVQKLGNSFGCYIWIKASLSVTQSHSTHFNISSYSDCHSTHRGSPVQRHGMRKHMQQPVVSQSLWVCHSTLLSASPILHTSLYCSWQDAVLITIPSVFTDTKGCVLKAAAQTGALYRQQCHQSELSQRRQLLFWSFFALQEMLFASGQAVHRLPHWPVARYCISHFSSIV